VVLLLEEKSVVVVRVEGQSLEVGAPQLSTRDAAEEPISAAVAVPEEQMAQMAAGQEAEEEHSAAAWAQEVAPLAQVEKEELLPVALSEPWSMSMFLLAYRGAYRGSAYTVSH
jgi:hypothetical protein